MQQGYAFGSQQRQEREQRNRLVELEGLSSKVISGDLEATNRAYALDPNQAKTLQGEGDRRRQKLYGLATSLKRAEQNPQLQAALYRSAVPYMRSEFGPEIPDMFDSASVMPIVEQVLAQGDPQALSGNMPTDVRSFQMMTAGLSPEDQMRARRINLGLDGRASNAGYGFFDIVGADGRPRKGRENPRTGSLEVYDEATGDFSPIGTSADGMAPAASAAPQAGQQHFGDFTSLAGEFPGVTMTSGMRTAERNQQVGGTANSQHLTGTAADYAVPQQLKPAFISRARQMGYQAIDEGDHIHLQLPRGGRAGASAGLAVGRRKEDEARAVAQAQSDVELSSLPTKLDMQTDAALREAGGKAAVEAGAKRQAVQAENNRAFSLYDTAMKGVSEGLGSSMTGPLAGRLPAVTAGQQIAEGGVAAIAPVLKQLFRSSGEGTFTDKDQELLLAMIPTRTDLPEARDWKIANIDRIVREKLGQPAKGSGQANGGRTVVRTGTSNGRKVIQYSDGSVEYGN